jgi:hypothetical protein
LFNVGPDGDVDGRPEEIWISEIHYVAHTDGNGDTGTVTKIVSNCKMAAKVVNLHASHSENWDQHDFRPDRHVQIPDEEEG